jgi:SAM-dependent methyltransferase
MANDGADYVMIGSEADTERQRLARVEAAYDPVTTRCFERLGVTEGWRCLEVGAGAGSIARWLGHRVGPAGHVVAADIDPRFLDELPDNVSVERLDIRGDDLEEKAYDLIHCRLLLVHLPDPAAVLARMAAALRPGGVLLAEELDCGVLHHHGPPAVAGPANEAYARLYATFKAKGFVDVELGRRLPGMMGDAGLDLIAAEFNLGFVAPGDPLYEVQRGHDTQAMPAMVAAGLLTQTDADALRVFHDAPGTAITSTMIVSVLAQRP